MKKKYLFICIFFGLLIFSGVNLRTIQLTGENDELTENVISDEALEIKSIPKSSAYTVRDRIYIDDSLTGVGAQNWTWAKDQGICTGYGNSTHPYIIENYEINGGCAVGPCIYILNSMAYFEIRNCYIYNGSAQAIRLENTGNGTISNNIILQDYWASFSATIYLFYNCVNNTIFNNTCSLRPIRLEDNCDDNKIYQNTIICKDESLVIGMGISLYDSCDNNNITGNYIARYNYKCDTHAVWVDKSCHYNIFHRNFFKSKDASSAQAEYGIFVGNISNGTEITENYFISFQPCINLYFNSDDTKIQDNILSAVSYYYFIDADLGCDVAVISGNYYLPKAPELYVNKVNQTYSETAFQLGLEVVSSQNFDFELYSLEMDWDGDPVPQDDIIDKGNGFYEVSLSPKFVAPGADPILFSMSIDSWTHADMYYELDIAVDPEAVAKGALPPGDDDDDDDDDDDEDTGDIVVVAVIVVIASVVIGVAVVYVLIQKGIIGTNKTR